MKERQSSWLMVEAVSKNNDVMAWNVIDEGGKMGTPWLERQGYDGNLH